MKQQIQRYEERGKFRLTGDDEEGKTYQGLGLADELSGRESGEEQSAV